MLAGSNPEAREGLSILVQDAFPDAVPTAPLADACLRLRVEARAGPSTLRPLLDGALVAGPARPVRHAGSVDVFLEAIHHARAGDVLVIDNEGRDDEACIGDLVAIEAAAKGLAGIVGWGYHRDTLEIRRIGLPVWSLGRLPWGPREARASRGNPAPDARLGDAIVSSEDVVVADDDGVLVLPLADYARAHAEARLIQAREREQAALVQNGRSLWAQLSMDEYVKRRAEDASYDLRRHLRLAGREIEE